MKGVIASALVFAVLRYTDKPAEQTLSEWLTTAAYQAGLCAAGVFLVNKDDPVAGAGAGSVGYVAHKLMIEQATITAVFPEAGTPANYTSSALLLAAGAGGALVTQMGVERYSAY